MREKSSLTFTLLSDLHYKKGMYPATVADLNQILDRADKSDSAFVLCAGDMWNDLGNSPELEKTYFHHITKNGSVLPAYNIYGNHELESDQMNFVNAHLTNDTAVIWGTADGTYREDIGYYYFECKGFRVVCLDSNYSLNPQNGQYEHNRAYSWGAPDGNLYEGSLGTEQLEWLETVLTDAADKEVPCIVVSHHGVSDLFLSTCPDRKKIREIFNKINAIREGTVLMVINGHEHTCHAGFRDGIFYYEINTVLNGCNVGFRVNYADNHTFLYEEYDDEGNLLNIYPKKYIELSWDSCYYFDSPVSAVVHINTGGEITVEGVLADWAYGKTPQGTVDGKNPYSISGKFCRSKDE